MPKYEPNRVCFVQYKTGEMRLKMLKLAALLPLVFLLSAGTEALAGVEDVWNASPPTNDTVWAQEHMRQVGPGDSTSGRVRNWRSHAPYGSFTATKDGYLTVKSCHNCTVSISASGAERCYVDRRDKYGQGRVSCSSIIQKGESYSISGAESASWRDIE
jgi:hypothetical protein